MPAPPASSRAGRSVSRPDRDAAALLAAPWAGQPAAVTARQAPYQCAFRELADAAPRDAARADAGPPESDAPLPAAPPASARAVQRESVLGAARPKRPESDAPVATALCPAQLPPPAAWPAPVSALPALQARWTPQARRVRVAPAPQSADESVFPSPAAAVSALRRKPDALRWPGPALPRVPLRAPRRLPARPPRRVSPPLLPRHPPLASTVPPPRVHARNPHGPTSGAT